MHRHTPRRRSWGWLGLAVVFALLASPRLVQASTIIETTVCQTNHVPVISADSGVKDATRMVATVSGQATPGALVAPVIDGRSLNVSTKATETGSFSFSLPVSDGSTSVKVVASLCGSNQTSAEVLLSTHQSHDGNAPYIGGFILGTIFWLSCLRFWPAARRWLLGGSASKKKGRRRT